MPLELPHALWMPPKPGILRAAPDIKAPYLGMLMFARTAFQRANQSSGPAAPALAITSIGTASAAAASGTFSITVPAGGVPAGAAIIVCIHVGFGTRSVADTAGNTYTEESSASAITPLSTIGSVFTKYNCAALVSGNTITVTKDTGNAGAASAFYITGGITGVLTETVFANVDQNNATSTNISANIGSSTAKVWLGIVASDAPTADTFTQPGGWATPPVRISSNTGSPVVCIAGSTQIAGGSTKTYNPSWSASRNYGSCLVAFG